MGGEFGITWAQRALLHFSCLPPMLGGTPTAD